MKIALGIVAALIAIATAYVLQSGRTTNQSRITAMNPQTPEIIPISHATAVITWGDRVIYADPVGKAKAFAGQPPADIVLVTDIHGDHFSTSTLTSVVGTNTSLIVPQAVMDQLPEYLKRQASILNNGESHDEKGFRVTAVPMYNIPESSGAFHTKGRGNGYVIERDGKRVYIAGDTSATPEMRALTEIDTALIPMNLPYTMSVEEAADGVLAFKPRRVYPYHYRGPDGLSDTNQFKELVNRGDPNIDVILLNWYPGDE